jgi:cation diffusion facilitator family transporter
MVGSLMLAAIKVGTGVAGTSQALIADGIESLSDFVASLAVLAGISLANKPPDENHPWGHGKRETLAALFVSLVMMGGASVIAWSSLKDILSPQEGPAWFTLPVLVLVVVAKVWLSGWLARTGEEHGSGALSAESWHHLSDAITSGAAFVGICIALVGGEGWEAADDWAALLACAIIVTNAVSIGHGALHELSEGTVDFRTENRLRVISSEVSGVKGIEKLRARKSGRGILMDIHVQVDGQLTVAEGHHIGGCVKYTLLRSPEGVADVMVHIEPYPAEESGVSGKESSP